MMQFSATSIQSIKSISQRALTLYWNRLARGRCFPAIAEFDPEPRLHDPRQLVRWTIEDGFGQRRFRALYQGANVTEVFNSSWAGRTMGEFDRKTVLRKFETLSQVVFAGRIRSGSIFVAADDGADVILS